MIMETHTCIYRSLTNDRDLAKQYFTLVFDDRYEPTILIRKLILSKDGLDCLKMIKTYKDWYLYEQRFGIKYNTIAPIVAACSEIINRRLITN